MRRPALLAGPDLWPDGGATRRLGLVMLTVLSLLTALALLAHVGTSRATGDWTSRMSSEATALIRPRADESGPTAAARAAEALAGVRGVREAVALERAEAEALLRPWLGEADLATLPLPQLVRLRLDPAEPASAVSLNRALAEAGVDGTVDDHSLWRTDFVGAARGVHQVTLIALLGAALLTATALVLGTRQAVESRDGALRALQLAGADEGTLTALAQWHMGRDAALAGAIGAGLALLAGLVVALAPLTGTLGRILPLILTDLVWLAPWPLVTAVVAAVAARLSIRLWLGRQRAGG
ncbi:ABC transporter permease [Brevundimonas sp.]|uniref:ABC transporter permease n=1 Tax=Brevundimonas sp. TaxID=1871086 RepID=UPI003AF76440